ncbi:glutamate receptor-like [Nasonia vitripennis]|uniref:Uncharacterized protein n=1 Tax=Nasonia vitripennis TaxID=7425 RepID=A0A7M7Q5F0_NASVI|nr:glutamate receptor-like [Nasonia vitripennis]
MGTLSNIGNSKTKVVLDVDEFGFFNAATQESVGLMRSMNEKEADIAQVVFSVATNRMPVIDYTLPLVRAQTRFFAKLPDDVKIQWSAYFRVFNSQVWALIGFSLLFFPMLLTLMKNKFEKFIGIHSFFGNFVDMLGVYCQQGLPEPPVSVSLRMLYFSILILSLILYAIYSATITSYIAVLKTDLPFSTYDE